MADNLCYSFFNQTYVIFEDEYLDIEYDSNISTFHMKQLLFMHCGFIISFGMTDFVF